MHALRGHPEKDGTCFALNFSLLIVAASHCWRGAHAQFTAAIDAATTVWGIQGEILLRSGRGGRGTALLAALRPGPLSIVSPDLLRARLHLQEVPVVL
jgi:hypothetical protein